jgi:hypothetical protein
MSNPKEKSKELVWKYYHNIEHTISNEYSYKDWEIAKQCALIAVDECLKTCVYSMINYWQEVKQEIEKL